MADRSSRNRDTPTYRIEQGDREIELYEPRPFPLAIVRAVHTVSGRDRLDLLAHEYYGDPHQYWRIADANPSAAAEDVLDPGATILIPEDG